MMTNIKKVREIINNRPVIIMLHGKSIEGLEATIKNLKDKDICYTSLNYFDLMEDHILNQIDEHLDFVFDMAGIRGENIITYNTKRRIPRWKRMFERDENNLILTNKGVIRDLTEVVKQGELLQQYTDKIFLMDSLGIDLRNVPNSAFLLIAVCVLARAKKIIICGMDGFAGNSKEVVTTYYKQDLYFEHQKDAFGTTDISHLKGDTENFQIMAKNILDAYINLLDIDPPEIYNCSPNSLISLFPKITYTQLAGVV